MQILVQHQGQQMGPFSIEELRAALADGRVSPQDLAWWEGAASWVPVATVPGLNQGAAGDGSTLAVWSLILGIISFGCGFLTGIPGVICGHMALGRKSRAGVEKGKTLAIVGLVMGYAGTVLGTIMMVAMGAAIVVPAFASARKAAQMTRAVQNERIILMALNEYAEAHAGQYPARLEDMVGRELADNSMLRDPSALGNNGYIYLRPTVNDSGGAVVIVSRGKDGRGRRAVGHHDGSVEIIPYTPPIEP